MRAFTIIFLSERFTSPAVNAINNLLKHWLQTQNVVLESIMQFEYAALFIHIHCLEKGSVCSFVFILICKAAEKEFTGIFTNIFTNLNDRRLLNAQRVPKEAFAIRLTLRYLRERERNHPYIVRT